MLGVLTSASSDSPDPLSAAVIVTRDQIESKSGGENTNPREGQGHRSQQCGFDWESGLGDKRMDLVQMAAALQKFSGKDLTATLSNIESAVKGASAANCSRVVSATGADSDVLTAAAALKQIAGQIHVAIHAIGILLCLPRILESDERVEYVSLGAGNAGRAFDLETTHRVAEFKFIHWQGGSEAIRQNQLFKDFYLLAESPSQKRKYLYVLGTEHPLRFLNGGRSLDSVLSRNVKLHRDFHEVHGEQFKSVCEYFSTYRHLVAIEDVSRWVPELIANELESE